MGDSLIDFARSDARASRSGNGNDGLDHLVLPDEAGGPGRETSLSPREDTPFRFDYLAKMFGERSRATLEAYLRGDPDQAPLVVDLDPTTACNFSCPECISADLLNKDRIPTPRLQALIPELARAGVRGVVLIGGGEPLAHACMPEPIRQAHAHGLAVGLTTNGSLIERHLDTLADCVSWTRVSMDAATEATFQTFRPNRMRNSFNRIIAAMEALARRKAGALGYSFVIMRRPPEQGGATNIHEIFAAARLAREIGCDYFEAKPMFDMEHQLLPFSPQDEAHIDAQLAEARELEGPNFRIVATRSMAHLAERRIAQPKGYGACPTMSLRTTITPTGIYPCAYHRGREDKKLGSLDDGPFDEFWQSAARKAAMKKTDPRADCGFYCARHPINLVAHAVDNLAREGVDLLPYLMARDLKDVFL